MTDGTSTLTGAETTGGPAPDALLDVRDLRVTVGGGAAVPVADVSLHVRAGERVGLVGESGSGKSVTAMAVGRLIEHRGGRIDPASRILLDGEDLVTAPSRRIREVRARRIGMIFQDPLSSLNPVYTIGDQIGEAVRAADPAAGRKAARARAVDLLGHVGIADPGRRAGAYPHEFSGGMRQRAMIAMALAGEPELLIADEPTTALDVTVQAQILELLDRLVEQDRLAILLITHDLGVVAGFTDRLYVMYSGRIVESGPTDRVYARQSHPYTHGLIQAVPRLDHPRDEELPGIPGAPPPITERPGGCSFHPRCPLAADAAGCRTELPSLLPIPSEDPPEGPSGSHARCHRTSELDGVRTAALRVVEAPREQPSGAGDGTPVLEIKDLVKEFGGGLLSRRGGHRAVDGVSFGVGRGETLGIVGESGSGKSTIARCALRLEEPTAGTVTFRGDDVTAMNRGRLRELRRHVQMVFQDPYASLDPRRRVAASLAEPLRIHGMWDGAERGRARLVELLEMVGLHAADLGKYPHQFSGGQLQRIAIARALAVGPALIAFDEPVSSLDVSTQAEIITMLERIQRETGTSYLFIAHDLAVVRHISDRIAVVHRGRIVELGDSDDVCHRPRDTYTRTLLSAVPIPDPAARRRPAHESEESAG
ncbi:ABC transporter ATP-binding protein [Actinomadura sp. WMMB 499]|uniref:dipeptide ABC transporter ATP-binding protein n=1 Tax=Actinomadura sp. WMMB 499 TaxID=1219491 RepID=UPI001244C14A|nr:ABC transporter ATP-binding protein [Actinomadura sp. WMMB 499]QFG26176.1 ABC transporter ATP-binding protein [Actinomadura sp. WMMB 499]